MSEVPSGRQLFRLQHEGGVRSIFLDKNGHTLVTGGQKGTVRLWDLRDGRELRRFPQQGYVDARFTPDDRYLIADAQKELSVWLLSTGDRVAAIDKEALKDPFMSVLGVSPDSRLLLVASFAEHSVQVRTIPDLTIVARLLHDDDVFSGVFNKAGTTVHRQPRQDGSAVGHPDMAGNCPSRRRRLHVRHVLQS